MSSSSTAHATHLAVCAFLEEAQTLIPDLQAHYIRLNQMNAALHKLLKNIKNTDNLFDAQDIQLHAEMDQSLLDTLGSIKIFLNGIQKEIDFLYLRSIHVKNIDKGIFAIGVPHAPHAVQLVWQVGDKEIFFWEETDALGNTLKKSIRDIIPSVEVVA
jgi:hypothetical protein